MNANAPMARGSVPGDNEAPDFAKMETERLVDEYLGLTNTYDALDAEVDRAPEVISDDPTALRVGGLIKRFRDLWNRFEITRVVEVEPDLRRMNAKNAFFNGYRKKIQPDDKNDRASVFMADFEDSNSPTWRNNLDGQFNLRDAVNGTIGYVSPEGKRYELGERTAVLMVRPRGWHLDEKHFLVDGRPISGGLFDFG